MKLAVDEDLAFGDVSCKIGDGVGDVCRSISVVWTRGDYTNRR